MNHAPGRVVMVPMDDLYPYGTWNRDVSTPDNMVSCAELYDRNYGTQSIAERTRLLIPHMDSRDFEGCESCHVTDRRIAFAWRIPNTFLHFWSYGVCGIVIAAEEDGYYNCPYICVRQRENVPETARFVQTTDPRRAVNNLRHALVETGLRAADERD